MVTPNDFHRKKGLNFDGPLIDLEGESGIQLGIDLLGHKYSSESIRYFNLEVDYRPCSQATLNAFATIPYFLANSHLTNCICVLYLSNHHLANCVFILQTIILQTVLCYFLCNSGP